MGPLAGESTFGALASLLGIASKAGRLESNLAPLTPPLYNRFL